MASKTLTFGAGEFVYTSKDGVSHTITTSQTMTVDLTATGYYKGVAGSSMTFTNANGPIKLEADPNGSSWYLGSSTSAVLNPGMITFLENGFERTQWKIRTMTVDNSTTPTTLSAVLERVDNPMVTITWTSIAVS